MLGLDTNAETIRLSDITMTTQWELDNQTITVGSYDEEIYCFISHQGQDRQIKSKDIEGIPKGIDLAVLPAFLDKTWVRISQFSDGTEKLTITPKLVGGANITTDPARFWPGGIIPYAIDKTTYPVGKEGRQIILAAINEWNRANTGFKLVPHTNQKDVLVFGEDKSACYSDVGRHGGIQYIRCHLEGHIFNKASIMHEIGHAIGFFHEQQRFDRDNYITLAHDIPGANYGKTNVDNAFGSYDLASIMHYPVNTTLSDGQQMIVKPGVLLPQFIPQVGNRQSLSSGDIAAARALYEKTIQHDQQALQQTGDNYFNGEDYSTAYQYYIASIQGYVLADDISSTLYNLCGVCLYRLNRYSDAQQYFKAALKINPNDQTIQTNYFKAAYATAKQYLVEANQLFNQGNYQQAISYYDLLIKDYSGILEKETISTIYQQRKICANAMTPKPTYSSVKSTPTVTYGQKYALSSHQFR